jgi:cell division protein FtsB
MGYAVAGIIVLVAGGLCWLSLKTWRWPNVVLLFLNICAISVFGYLAGYTLKVHSAWRSVVNKQSAELAQVTEKADRVLNGYRDANGELEKGIRQLQQEVRDLIVRRGPAWFEVAVARKPAADGATDLTIENPSPHGLVEQSIVYAFELEPGKAGGRYLGEFKVTKAAAGEPLVSVAPTTELTPEEQAALGKARGEWVLYQKMPTDENDVFTLLSDEQAEELLLDDMQEYRKGDRPAESFNDYVYLFHQHRLQRKLLEQEMVEIQSRIERLAESEVRNQGKIKYRQGEIAELKSDLEGFETERVTVVNFLQQLQAKDGNLAAELATLRKENAAMAAEIKALQTKAADLINARTNTAQAGQ